MAVSGARYGLPGLDKAASSQDVANGLVAGTFAAIGPGKAFSAWGPFNVLVWATMTTTLTVATSGTNAATVASATNLAVGNSINSSLAPPGTTIKTLAGTDVTFAFPTQMWQGRINAGVAAIDFGSPTLPNGTLLATLVGSAVSDPNGYFPSGVTVLGVGPDGTTVLTSAAPTTAPSTNPPAPIYFALTANCLVAGADAAAKFNGAATPVGQATTSFQIERSLDGGVTWVCCNISQVPALAQYTNLTGPLSVTIADAEANAMYRLNVIAFNAAGGTPTNNYRFSTSGQAGLSLAVPTP